MKSKVRAKRADRPRDKLGCWLPKDRQHAPASVGRNEDEMVRRLGPLSSEDVCAIVDKCNQCSVQSLSFRGLELSFQPKDAPLAAERVDVEAPSTAAATNARLEETRRKLRELDGATVADNLAGIRADNIETVEDELEMLKVTNPSAYEAAMLEAGEFQDAQPG